MWAYYCSVSGFSWSGTVSSVAQVCAVGPAAFPPLGEWPGQAHACPKHAFCLLLQLLELNFLAYQVVLHPCFCSDREKTCRCFGHAVGGKWFCSMPSWPPLHEADVCKMWLELTYGDARSLWGLPASSKHRALSRLWPRGGGEVTQALPQSQGASPWPGEDAVRIAKRGAGSTRRLAVGKSPWVLGWSLLLSFESEILGHA